KRIKRQMQHGIGSDAMFPRRHIEWRWGRLSDRGEFRRINEEIRRRRALSRNWRWKLLTKRNELEVQRIGFFFKPFNALQPELLFVMFDTFFNVFVPIAQHTINEPSEMMGHSDDGLGSTESGSQAAIFGSQRALTVGEALGTKSKGVSGSVVDLARGST